MVGNYQLTGSSDAHPDMIQSLCGNSTGLVKKLCPQATSISVLNHHRHCLHAAVNWSKYFKLDLPFHRFRPRTLGEQHFNF